MLQYKCEKCGGIFAYDEKQVLARCPYGGNDCITNNHQQQSCGGTPPPFRQDLGIFDCGPSGKSRGVAALLAILIGCLGVQYFYVGKNSCGIMYLLITLFTCGVAGGVLSILSIVQGVIMLGMTQEQFEAKYVYSPSSFVF